MTRAINWAVYTDSGFTETGQGLARLCLASTKPTHSLYTSSSFSTLPGWIHVKSQIRSFLFGYSLMSHPLNSSPPDLQPDQPPGTDEHL